ncbi:hypothetical protein YC2023_013443 [Brassica napus]
MIEELERDFYLASTWLQSSSSVMVVKREESSNTESYQDLSGPIWLKMKMDRLHRQQSTTTMRVVVLVMRLSGCSLVKKKKKSSWSGQICRYTQTCKFHIAENGYNVTTKLFL